MQNNSTPILSFEQLAQNILLANDTLQGFATKTINRTITLRNWLIEYYIVEYEQHGSDRAKYGERLLKNLEQRISVRGMNVTLFQFSRLLYRIYPQLNTVIQNNYATSHILLLPQYERTADYPTTTYQTPADIFVSSFSFSHIRELLTIEDPLVRFFYETECINGTWSVRELRRQISSNLHIRIGLSEDKLKAMALVNNTAEQHTPLLSIRDPYTFEFLGLKA